MKNKNIVAMVKISKDGVKIDWKKRKIKRNNLSNKKSKRLDYSSP